MACVTLVFEYWWYKYRKATPKITTVAETTATNSEKMERKDMGVIRSKDTTDVKNISYQKLIKTYHSSDKHFLSKTLRIVTKRKWFKL